MVGVYSAINEGYWKLLERGEITKPELFTRRFRDFFGKIGVTCDEAEFNALYQTTQEKISRMEAARLGATFSRTTTELSLSGR